MGDDTAAAEFAIALDTYVSLRESNAVRPALLAQAVTHGDEIDKATAAQRLGELDRLEARYGDARANYGAPLKISELNRKGAKEAKKIILDLRAHRVFAVVFIPLRCNLLSWTATLMIAEQIPDTVGQLNTPRNLALLEQVEGNLPAARDFYRRALALAESIPAFKDHPITQSWRRELADLGD